MSFTSYMAVYTFFPTSDKLKIVIFYNLNRKCIALVILNRKHLVTSTLIYKNIS